MSSLILDRDPSRASPKRREGEGDRTRASAVDRRTPIGPGDREVGAIEFFRLLAATLAFYAALIFAPLLGLLPIALLGLILGIIGLALGGW